MKTLYKPILSAAVAAAFAIASFGAVAQNSLEIKQDKAQLKSDQAGLKRAEKKLKTDKAKLNANEASGKMSAESADSMKVYRSERSVKRLRAVVAAGEPGSAQLKADKRSLRRAERQLKADKEQLAANKAAGKMSAESKDGLQVSRDERSVKGETAAVAASKAELKADQTKVNQKK